jgi:hypothetical protein
MEPDGSLRCSQKPAIGPYPEPDESSPHPHTYFFKITASHPMGTGDPSRGIKRPGHETDHSPPSSAEDMNSWSYIFTPPYVFIAWCLAEHRDNFALSSILLYLAQVLQVISSLQDSQLKFRMYFSISGTYFVFRSSYLPYLKTYYVKSTNYEAPCYIFFILLFIIPQSSKHSD